MRLKLLFCLITFIVLLSMTGCSGRDENNNSSTQPIEDEEISGGSSEVILSKPPSLAVDVGDEKIRPTLGTYSWSIDNGDGSGVAIEADSAAPPELVKNTQPTQVTSDTNVELNFERQPDRYEVRIWDDKPSIINSSDEVILSGKGKVVYEVLAYWEQGTASYTFSVNIK